MIFSRKTRKQIKKTGKVFIKKVKKTLRWLAVRNVEVCAVLGVLSSMAECYHHWLPLT